MPPTKPIYQYDETARKHSTRITSLLPFPQLDETLQPLFKTASPSDYILETHETIFYPQGGGQPCDTGTIVSPHPETQKPTTFTVTAVRNAPGGRVLHLGIFTPGTIFEAGELVEQNINSERRDLNSRIHTAGHVIASAVRALMAAEEGLSGVSELKAQHYPDVAFVEFKGLIGGEFRDIIQEAAQGIVDAGREVRLFWVLAEELEGKGVVTPEGMPVVAGADGRVRVVEIEGYGGYPCGGTHVEDTGAVGRIVIKGVKRQKGISKVSYAVEGKT